MSITADALAVVEEAKNFRTNAEQVQYVLQACIARLFRWKNAELAIIAANKNPEFAARNAQSLMKDYIRDLAFVGILIKSLDGRLSYLAEASSVSCRLLGSSMIDWLKEELPPVDEPPAVSANSN